MKLAAQLTEKMGDSSHIWAPPIYRRLLSNDKKEKDMSERCLLQIKTVIFPTSSALSKVCINFSLLSYFLLFFVVLKFVHKKNEIFILKSFLFVTFSF